MSDLQKHIQAENAAAIARGSCFTTVEDPAHWQRYGVNTVEDYILYNARAEVWDLYKDLYGIRPRSMGLYEMTLKEVTAWAKSLRGQIRFEVEAEAASKAEAERKIAEALTEHPLTQKLAIPSFA